MFPTCLQRTCNYFLAHTMEPSQKCTRINHVVQLFDFAGEMITSCEQSEHITQIVLCIYLQVLVRQAVHIPEVDTLIVTHIISWSYYKR